MRGERRSDGRLFLQKCKKQSASFCVTRILFSPFLFWQLRRNFEFEACNQACLNGLLLQNMHEYAYICNDRRIEIGND
jgi:hypothetical protein